MKYFNNKGFSIIEILVTTAIIVVMSSVAIVKMSQTKPADKLADEKKMMASIFQLARSYAISGYNPNSANINGYGVYIAGNSYRPSQTNYILYANAVGSVDAYNAGVDTKLEEYNLSNSVYVSNTGCSSSATTNPCYILFTQYTGAASKSYTFTLKTSLDSTLSNSVGINVTTGKIQ